MSDYLTTEQAAERIQMTADYVVRQCKAGAIHAVKLGNTWRIAEAALADFMAPGVTIATTRPGRTARQRRRSA